MKWGFGRPGWNGYALMGLGLFLILATGAVPWWDQRRVTEAVARGERRDITLRAIGAATIYYTLIFFAVALVLLILVRLLKPRRPAGIDSPVLAELRQSMADRLHTDADIVRRPAAPDVEGGKVEDRLRHLQSLRDGGLVSEEEYRAKRADILGGL